MKADYVHNDTLTATDYVELNKNNELLISYNQQLLKEKKQLQQENQQLKKQLKPDYYVKGLEGTLKEYQQEMNKVAIQQKEFIKYLEDELDRLARECSQIYEDSLGKTRLVNEDIFNEANKILQKYKSIIGVSDEKED